MAPQWRTLSVSAELMVDPEWVRVARSATQGGWGGLLPLDVTLLDDDLPLAAGRTRELAEARAAAEAALAGVTDWHALPDHRSGDCG
jgi:hypothetical protein